MSEEKLGIRISGLGGQGIVLAGLLLGHAAVRDGFYAAGANFYGSQSRGSLCTAEVLLSSAPIDYPRVESADLLAAMSREGYDACAARMAPNGRIFYDAGLVTGLRAERDEKGFDVTAISLQELEGKQAANVIWTGILAGATGWLQQQSLEEAIKENVAAPFVELNLRALRLGMKIGREAIEQ